MEQKVQNQETDNPEVDLNAVAVVLKAFDELGINAMPNDDGSLTAYCDGLDVRLEFSGSCVRFWDRLFFSISYQDPLASLVHLAVNDTNLCFGPTVILTDVNKGNNIGLYSRFDLALHKDFPNNTELIKMVIESFHNTRQVFEENLENRIAKRMEAQKKRRPIGFATND